MTEPEFVGAPNYRYFFEALDRIRSKKCGKEIVLTKIVDRETGEVIYQKT